MKQAIEEVRIDPGIDYLNAHATSTPAGDPSEIKAVAAIFGEKLSGLNISAIKSMTGHLLGASGAIEAVATINAILNNLVPPTLHTKSPDPEIPDSINLTLAKVREREITYALSNNFGFGGHNATIVFRKFEE